MIEFAVSPLLGKENGQGENGPNAPAGVEGEADTQTSHPPHNAQSGGEREKTDMFPQSALDNATGGN